MPLSHDEVVHGKATIVQKMNGKYKDKFPQAKALYLYMFAHPGKKLNFMGNELGTLREWDENKELDWNHISYPIHDAFNSFIRDLNKIYLSYPALFKLDYDRKGVSWVDCSQEKKCIYVFERCSDKQNIFAIFNFSDKEQTFKHSTVENVFYHLLIASDMECYGGKKAYTALETSFNSKKVIFTLSPFSGRYYLTNKY